MFIFRWHFWTINFILIDWSLVSGVNHLKKIKYICICIDWHYQSRNESKCVYERDCSIYWFDLMNLLICWQREIFAAVVICLIYNSHWTHTPAEIPFENKGTIWKLKRTSSNKKKKTRKTAQLNTHVCLDDKVMKLFVCLNVQSTHHFHSLKYILCVRQLALAFSKFSLECFVFQEPKKNTQKLN